MIMSLLCFLIQFNLPTIIKMIIMINLRFFFNLLFSFLQTKIIIINIKPQPFTNILILLIRISQNISQISQRRLKITALIGHGILKTHLIPSLPTASHRLITTNSTSFTLMNNRRILRNNLIIPFRRFFISFERIFAQI